MSVGQLWTDMKVEELENGESVAMSTRDQSDTSNDNETASDD